MGFSRLQAELDARHEAALLRRRRVIEPVDGRTVKLDGRAYLNFSGNDYLGLAHSDELKAVAVQAAERVGAGSSASPLVTGFTVEHARLEAFLCERLGYRRALLFNAGFSANHSLIHTLMKDGGTILADRLSHASMLDGATHTKARLMRFRHNDSEHLAQLMTKAKGDTLVISEGVFSMDGDRAPLAELAQTATANNSLLMLDDAHGFGISGETGFGSVAASGLDATQVPLLMATFGKAVGTSGAFVACDELLFEYLLNFARDYIYSTAMSPLMAAVTLGALQLMEHQSWRRDRLNNNIALFRHLAQRAGLPLSESQTAIQPIILGDAAKTLAMSQKLERDGVMAVAIRPPTVPVDSARIRITLSAAHQDQDIQQLVTLMEQAFAKPD
ncbi:Glycine C-acetyltransferase [Saliniradius amylolyticus]|uniref:8-amino-7-ketopelargonate synthase n=1 Tax=Saliniradius amylolyticus TaxID=2183582 RepID=A0A2S2E2R0_9ALTE|nr:8-amino-7-oxononanoate synthase [Saliniradius amylolyticus]AWL11812.1 Glycine C-acetyltransferase [Saliniradius amylolyticus]